MGAGLPAPARRQSGVGRPRAGAGRAERRPGACLPERLGARARSASTRSSASGWPTRWPQAAREARQRKADSLAAIRRDTTRVGARRAVPPDRGGRRRGAPPPTGPAPAPATPSVPAGCPAAPAAPPATVPAPRPHPETPPDDPGTRQPAPARGGAAAAGGCCTSTCGRGSGARASVPTSCSSALMLFAMRSGPGRRRAGRLPRRPRRRRADAGPVRGRGAGPHRGGLPGLVGAGGLLRRQPAGQRRLRRGGALAARPHRAAGERQRRPGPR